MSTNYYYPSEPITRVELATGETHDTVKVWVGDEFAGTLTVKAGNGHGIVLMFAEKTDDLSAPMSTYWGGDARGCVVAEQVRGLDPDLILISEYGEPITVREIRALAGKGKRK